VSHSYAQRAPKSIVAVLLAVALGVTIALFAPSGRAAAADFGSTPITSVTISPTTIAHSGTAQVDFTWAAPAGAAPGDTFTITLPDQLEPVSTRAIELVDAGTGEVAVLGSWAGKTATFTFASYIGTHTGVRGTGFFYVRWDHDVTGSPGATFNDLELGGVLLPPITKGVAGPPVQNRDASKDGGWSTSEQLQFTWVLNFPASTAAAIGGPVTVTDTPDADAGFTFDLIAASVSHLASGDPAWKASIPLGFLAMLMVSYGAWRRLHGAVALPPDRTPRKLHAYAPSRA
jgi:hypothetical protein